MFKVLRKTNIADNLYKLDIEAPAIAAKVKPGQFIMLLVDEKGERIPITICGWDRVLGTISIVVSKVGTSTTKLTSLSEGSEIDHITGPLGKVSEIDNYGNVLVAGMGYGAMAIQPLAKELKAAGCKIYSAISGGTQSEIVPIDTLKEISEACSVMTMDGTSGETSWITDAVEKIISENKIDRIIMVGSLCAMEAVSGIAKKHDIEYRVSLNPIMVDGTGMCGACRCNVDGKTKFACVDGPEFDGRKVDWEQIMMRRCPYPAKQAGSIDIYHCRACGQW